MRNGPANEVPLSIVLPVFNASAFLADAIESVLAQDFREFELCVIDDASRDGSLQIAERYAAADARVRVIGRERNGGDAAARNDGLARSGAELVTFLDADDSMLPGRLRFQVNYLTDHPEADVLMNCQEIDLQEGLRPPRWLRDLPPPGEQPRFCLMSMMARRSAFERTGCFDPSFRISSDLDWFTRAMAAGIRIHKVDRSVIRRRIHGGNLTFSADAAMQRATFRSLHARILERRNER